MAQGGLKKRSEKFAGVPSKSKGKQKKPLGPKKGAHYIAPKKGKKTKAVEIKKQLQKQIGRRIEQDVTQRASKDGTEFRILSAPKEGGEPSTSASSSSSRSKTKTKKTSK